MLDDSITVSPSFGMKKVAAKMQTAADRETVKPTVHDETQGRLDKPCQTVANLLRLRVPTDIIHWRACLHEHR